MQRKGKRQRQKTQRQKERQKGRTFSLRCKGKSRPTHNAREAKDAKAKDTKAKEARVAVAKSKGWQRQKSPNRVGRSGPSPTREGGGRGNNNQQQARALRKSKGEFNGALKRKQVPICSYHHKLYHKGELNFMDLKDISNLR
jgi:hypothetical protein